MGNDSPTTDQELVRQVLQDPAAYSLIFDRYYKPLLRYIRRLGCQNDDDAQDILQETFLNAYINLNDYDADLKFSSWIYRIAHNAAVSFFRKQNIRVRTLTTEDQSLAMDMIADDGDIATEVEHRFLREQISTALGRLDEKYRDVLILRFLEEKEYREISDVLHIPLGTVGTLVARGKEQLKSMLNKTHQ